MKDSLYILLSLQSYNLYNQHCNIVKNVRTEYKVKDYLSFFLGIGICFGGLSMKDFSNWCIISDKGRSCSSLSLSSNFLTSSVVRNEINSDLLCLIEYIMLDKNNLNHNIYNIRLCMTIYE